MIKGCVPVDGDTYDVPAIIETAETRARAHGLPLPTSGHREKFGNDPAKHRDFSAVTHVAKGKGIPPFLILHVAEHPDTGRTGSAHGGGADGRGHPGHGRARPRHVARAPSTTTSASPATPAPRPCSASSSRCWHGDILPRHDPIPVARARHARRHDRQCARRRRPRQRPRLPEPSRRRRPTSAPRRR